MYACGILLHKHRGRQGQADRPQGWRYKRIPLRYAERGCQAEDGQLDMVQEHGQDTQGGQPVLLRAEVSARKEQGAQGNEGKGGGICRHREKGQVTKTICYEDDKRTFDNGFSDDGAHG